VCLKSYTSSHYKCTPSHHWQRRIRRISMESLQVHTRTRITHHTLMERPTVNAQTARKHRRGLILHCAIQRVEILNVQRVDGILVKLSILSILVLVFVVVLLLLRLTV